MKVWSGVLQLVLILNVVVLAEDNYHSTTDSDGKKKVGNSILHRLRKRENPCRDDEYRSENFCCKLCDAGRYAEADCDEEHGYPKCNNCIEGRNYMDIKNGDHRCHICSSCEDGIALKEQHACTLTRNTVCKCTEDFFCTENKTTESDGCTNCQHCTKCDHGYAERCSSIKDAVCDTPSQTQRHYYTFIAVVVILILLIWYFCRKRCNTNTKYSPVGKKPFVFPDKLKDIDLTHHLSDFAQNMDFPTVREVARKSGIEETTIERIIRDNQNDCQEQKFQLLNTWYNAHGRIGAFQDLIEKLQEASKQLVVENLLKIAEDQWQQSQA